MKRSRPTNDVDDDSDNNDNISNVNNESGCNNNKIIDDDSNIVDSHHNSIEQKTIVRKSRKTPPIFMGATEFASILNSDDPIAIVRCLKRFVQIVRYERKVVFSSLATVEDGTSNKNKNIENDEDDDESIISIDEDDDVAIEENEEVGQNKEKDDDESMGKKDSVSNKTTKSKADKIKDKRYKKDESWKQDTANYNVPFVGTSISTASDRYVYDNNDNSTIKPDYEWPTGLLKQYLQKSPLAVELTSGMLIPGLGGSVQKSLQRKHRGKISHTIYKYYLRSIAELITAAISPATLLLVQQKQKQCGDDSMYDKNSSRVQQSMTDFRFINEITMKRLQGFFQLLKQETGNGKGKLSGSSGSDGCGDLARFIVRILYNISLTSVSSARTVCRSFMQSTVLSEAVIRFLLRPCNPATSNHKKKPPKRNKKDDNSMNDDDDPPMESNKLSPRHECRRIMLELVCSLCDMYNEDASIMTSICSNGSKERKINPGIFNVALRDGIRWYHNYSDNHSNNNNKHHIEQREQRKQEELSLETKRLYQVWIRLIRNVRNLMVRSDNGNEITAAVESRKRSSTMEGVLVELASRDAIQNICHFIGYAPKLFVPFESIISASDQYDDADDDTITTTKTKKSSKSLLQDVGIEARRFIFCLLTDKYNSPLLQSITKQQHKKYSDKYNLNEQTLVRCILSILEATGTTSSLTEIHRFVLHVLSLTPELLPELFRTISIPEHRSHEQQQSNVFEYMSQLNLISKIIRYGPTVSECYNPKTRGDENSKYDESIVYCIIPRSFKKQLFNRAMQSSNHLIMSETIKVILFALQRCKQYLHEINHFGNDDSTYKLWIALCNNLPDLQMLVTSLARVEIVSNERTKMKPNSIVYSLICEAICLMTTIFQTTTKDVSFDWMKLIPSDTKAFNAVPLVIQKSILHTLMTVVSFPETIQSFQIASFRSLFAVMLTTKSDYILKYSRSIARVVLRQLCSCPTGDNSERVSVLEYEASCWLDGLSDDLLDEFCSLVQKSTQQASMSIVSVAKAWKASNLPGQAPTLQFSPILVQSLLTINQMSETFAGLVCQVVSNCLLYMANPLPLAALIVHVSASTCALDQFQRLSEYSRALVNFTDYSGIERKILFHKMVQSCLPGTSVLLDVTKECGSHTSSEDNANEINGESLNYLALTRQLTHIILSIDERSTEDKCLILVQKILPVALMTANGDIASVFRRLLASLPRRCQGICDLIELVSLTATTGYSSIVEEVAEKCMKGLQYFNDPQMTTDSLKSILFLYLVGPFLTQHSIMQVLTPLLECNIGLLASKDSYARALAILYLKLFQEKLQMGVSRTKAANEIIHWVFKFFDAITSLQPKGSVPGELTPVTEQIICHSLLSDPMSMFMSDKPTNVLVQNALLLERREIVNIQSKTQRESLLDAMLQSDVARFSPEILALLSQNNSYGQILESGKLDSALLMAVRFEGSTTDLVGNKRILAEKILLRLEKLVSSKSTDTSVVDTSSSLLVALSDRKENIECLNTSAVIRITTDLIGEGKAARFGTFRSSTQLNILRFGLRFCQMKKCGNDGFDLTTSALLHRMMMIVPQALRDQIKRKDGEVLPQTEPIDLMRLLNEMMGSELLYDISYLRKRGPTFARALVRACLRYGIGNVEVSTLSIQTCCLQVVGTFVVALSSETSGIMELKDMDLGLLPSQIFEMVTTHSKFEMLISNPDIQATSLRIEVVRLLILCLRSFDGVPFEENVWYILLSSFTAGVTVIDELLRELIYMYGKSAPQNSPAHYLDQWKWGPVEKTKDSDCDWDWLLDSIELSRIQSTISRFPIDIKLLPIQSIENSCDFHIPSVHMSAHDARYNPGFLLPLILGALEDDADTNVRERFNIFKHSDNEKEADGELREETHKFQGSSQTIHFVQRLCEKGALALALCSLCSNCSSVRRTGFAILGLMLAAVDSKEAHRCASWRERPQIEMLLNAVIRALVIMRAESPGDEKGSFLVVPKLSGFAAVFLAKSEVILHYPSDPMYIATNRYFLRGEADSGAFQDSFKLPAFVFLFGSSTGDSQQWQYERKFALELVRDGLVDEGSYRLLLASYVPDLLLTALESSIVGSNAGQERESTLILRTLTKIVNNGGERSMHHLIGRLGLLSWLRSFLMGGQFFSLLSTWQSRVAFLQLATASILRASDELSTEEISTSTAGYSQAVLEVSLRAASERKVRQEELESTSQILNQASELLHALHKSTDARGISNDKTIFDHAVIRSQGIVIETANRFMSLFSSSSQMMKQETLHALCYLPLHYKSHGPEDALITAAFCDEVLREAIRLGEDGSKDLMLCVLQRISDLSRSIQAGTNLTPIIGKLLTWRKVCCLDQDVRTSWFQCLANVISREQDSLKRNDECGIVFLSRRALEIEGLTPH